MAKPITAMSLAEFDSFLKEAAALLERLEGGASRPLARGLLGAALIQDCVLRTNGDPAWWAEIVKSGKLPAGTSLEVVVDDAPKRKP